MIIQGSAIMLRSVKEIIGYSIRAKDGNIGRVRDFFIDESDWSIRYLIADTGNWIPGRQVLLSPASFGQPVWKQQILPVELTKNKIEKSPGIEKDMPISHQHEIGLHNYYGWSYYWEHITPAPPSESEKKETSY